jgi:hypothetical protein
MGSTHFLMKRLNNVKTEISLHILAYNLKRVMQILGAGPLISAMRTLGAPRSPRAIAGLPLPAASFYKASTQSCRSERPHPARKP